MSAKMLDPVDFIDTDRTLVFEDNFLWFISPHFWTATLTDTGSVVALTTHGGGIAITPSDGTVADNDEAYVGGTNKNLLPSSLKPILIQGTLQWSEGNTDDLNVIFGLSSTSAANALLDNGGGPPASYSGVVFFKVDGGNNWWVEVSVGGTQTTVELTAVNSLDKKAHTAGGTAKQTLKILIVPESATQAAVVFFIDGVPVYQLLWTYTSVVAMAPIIGMKNGGDTVVETLNAYNCKLKTIR